MVKPPFFGGFVYPININYFGTHILGAKESKRLPPPKQMDLHFLSQVLRNVQTQLFETLNNIAYNNGLKK